MAMSASPVLPSTDFLSRSCPSPPPSKTTIITEVEDDDQFRTPTTEESRLNSTPSTCPPPPMKAKRVVGCKRKLSELEFFKIEAEEIERLFRPRDLQCALRRKGNVCQEERETSSSLSSA